MNIFKHALRIGYGNSSLDNIAYYRNFPHYPRPYDFHVNKDDNGLFAFVMFSQDGVMSVVTGESGCSIEALVSDNGIAEKDIILKGRGWRDVRYAYIDKRELELKNYFELESLLMQRLGVDISNWYLLGGHIEAVIPHSVYTYELKKLNKQMQRLQAFLDRLLVNKETFEDFVRNNSERFDYEQIKDRVHMYLKEYSLFMTYGKTQRPRQEDESILSNLRNQLARLTGMVQSFS